MKSPSGIPLPESEFLPLVERALAEDIGSGDRTTRAVLPESLPAAARIRAKEPLVAAGLWLVDAVFRRLDPKVKTECRVSEGEAVSAGAVLAVLEGDARSLLAGERVALNFLQRLCGVATLTRKFVDAASGTRATIRDTRKTTPGWRALEKYAVRAGGGENHRDSLESGILIKDNHIALAGGLREAVRRAKASGSEPEGLEVEVESAADLSTALELLDPKRDILLLDNMDIPRIQEAVARVGGRLRVEVSGGVTLSTVRDIAACGVDFISVGALTHSAPSADISMEIVAAG
jgi:nicotinate-nucleotide pyrophosphorylase (carboxylating)